jgi:hypothetical protein
VSFSAPDTRGAQAVRSWQPFSSCRFSLALATWDEHSQAAGRAERLRMSSTRLLRPGSPASQVRPVAGLETWVSRKVRKVSTTPRQHVSADEVVAPCQGKPRPESRGGSCGRRCSEGTGSGSGNPPSASYPRVNELHALCLPSRQTHSHDQSGAAGSAGKFRRQGSRGRRAENQPEGFRFQ